MKKHFVSAAFVMTAAFGSAAAHAADSGTITFNGAVNDVTCPITNPGGPDLVVQLDTVPTADLATSGDVAALKPYTIMVGADANCTGNVTLEYLGSGSQVDGATGDLRSSGTATNVQVQLLDEAGSKISLIPGTPIATDTKTAPSAGGSVAFTHSAQYIATGAATPGSVMSAVTYRLTYN